MNILQWLVPNFLILLEAIVAIVPKQVSLFFFFQKNTTLELWQIKVWAFLMHDENKSKQNY